MNRPAKGHVGVVGSTRDTNDADGHQRLSPSPLHFAHEGKPTACLADDVYLAAKGNAAGNSAEFVL